MKKYILYTAAATAIFISGCLERKLTVNTEPQGALVMLNDEEVGETPVTVNFNWYGDYKILLSKNGYENLATHQKIKGPWYDNFPFDLFAQIYPGKITNSYELKYKLETKKNIDPKQLIDNAKKLQEQL